MQARDAVIAMTNAMGVFTQREQTSSFCGAISARGFYSDCPAERPARTIESTNAAPNPHRQAGLMRGLKRPCGSASAATVSACGATRRKTDFNFIPMTLASTEMTTYQASQSLDAQRLTGDR